MTLNIMGISPSKVFLSGDFRLTTIQGNRLSYKDDLSTQKLIPAINFDWSAIISFCGVAKTAGGLDVGLWLANRIQAIPYDARKNVLLDALMSANDWSKKVRTHNRLTISVVGFNERKPFAAMISNFQNFSGAFESISPDLVLSELKPKKPAAIPLGEWTSVKPYELGNLKKLLAEKVEPNRIHDFMANLNAEASRRTNGVSPICVTGHVMQSGKGEIRPHGVGDDKLYMPYWIRNNFKQMGFRGFVRKVDAQGNVLPLKWVGSTFAKSQESPNPNTFVYLHVIRNSEEPKEELTDEELGRFWNL